MTTAARSTAPAASSGVVLVPDGTGSFGYTIVPRLLAALPDFQKPVGKPSQ